MATTLLPIIVSFIQNNLHLYGNLLSVVLLDLHALQFRHGNYSVHDLYCGPLVLQTTSCSLWPVSCNFGKCHLLNY